MSEQSKSVRLNLQRRLAADILGCGKHRVAFVADKESLVAGAKSRSAIRKIISSKLIYKRQENSVSRGRFRTRTIAKRLGRHTGAGKRNGCRDARNPSKTQWIHRMRSQRLILRKYRDTKKLTPSQYNTLYYKVKGNQYRNKRILLEQIISIREEVKRQEAIKVRATEAKIASDARKKHTEAAKQKVAAK